MYHIGKLNPKAINVLPMSIKPSWKEYIMRYH